jgi:hypothetical protein
MYIIFWLLMLLYAYRETAVVTLWGPHATQFHAKNLQQQPDNGHVVMLFVGLTVKFRDRKK